MCTAISFLMSHEDVVVVGTACWGEQALAQAQDLRPDTVMIDVELPNCSAWQVIRRLRATLPQVIIIALTSKDDDLNQRAALEAGADDCLHEHALTTHLLSTTRELPQTIRG
jgi:two-component system alkaline phosphatase synthesis response regulator PhoP/two-component system response regulator VicR